MSLGPISCRTRAIPHLYGILATAGNEGRRDQRFRWSQWGCRDRRCCRRLSIPSRQSARWKKIFSPAGGAGNGERSGGACADLGVAAAVDRRRRRAAVGGGGEIGVEGVPRGGALEDIVQQHQRYFSSLAAGRSKTRTPCPMSRKILHGNP